MYNIVLVIHVIVVVFLIGMILIQRGRSGGLVEALGGVESIFGTKTSNFLVKLTVALAIGFFITSISLAYLSKERGKSLMGKYKTISVVAESEDVVEDVTGDITKDLTGEPSIPEEELSSQ